METETMQIAVGAEYHHMLKVEAARRGTTMKDIIEKALDEYDALDEYSLMNDT